MRPEGIWAVLDGEGIVRATAGDEVGVVEVTHPGAYPLIEHEAHREGTLAIEVEGGARCLATCFTPGVA